MLNRIQLQQTGISKKIGWIECNKSDSPYLVADFLVVVRDFACGLISRNVLKLESFNFVFLDSETPALITQDAHWQRTAASHWD